jgi:GAF domain-containing protein
MKFCGECGKPLTANPGGPPAPSYSEITSTLSDALEQQAATSQILRVISSSPADVQPVFAAVLKSAARLCDALDASIFQMDGDRLRLAAHEGPIPAVPLGEFSLRGTSVGRAVLDRRTIHVPDIQAEVDDYPEGSALARSLGHRTILTVPLLREGEAIGAIGLRRTEVRPFTNLQIELLETFAAQAVIAIENVRLFNETKEALEQQTATSEVLRVISSSPADLQPVMDAVAGSAARLCGADNVVVLRLEGAVLRPVAVRGPRPGVELPLSRGRPSGRAVIDRETIHVPDLAAAQDEFPEVATVIGQTRSRAILVTPLLSKGEAVGVILIRREEPGRFTDQQVTLLQTFAAQAVIAIENVRLFQELQARNRELTESLEQQTATAEILRVISSSPTDLQPVMNVVAESAARFCGAPDTSIWRLEGELLRRAATHGRLPASTSIGGTIAVSPRDVAGRAVLDRQTIHIEDLLGPPETQFPETQARLRRLHIPTRTMLATPLLRKDVPIGVIVMRRGEVQPFTAKQIELAKTFAAQAVIAIENVRLFQELQTRNAELAESLEQQTATSEILRVIASSPTDLEPVMNTVAANAARVCGATDASIFRLEGEHLRLVARHGAMRRSMTIGDTLPVGRGFVGGQVVCDARTIHVEDIMAAEAEFPKTVSRLRQAGSPIRTMLATPLLREGTPLGVIFINRGPEPNPFLAKQIALLETFANQAVIAIENVRLFTELEARNRDLTQALDQQTATGEILRVISASPTDVQPVFEVIVKNALRLCDGLFSTVHRVEGNRARLVAHRNVPESAQQAAEYLVIGPGLPESVTARAIRERAVVHVPDIEHDPAAPVRTKEVARLGGHQSIVEVPMLLEGRPVGTISVARREARAFSDEQISLLRTFADQAVIAIENVRLFKELDAKNRDLTEALEQQTATAEILRVISSSPTDLQSTFDAIVARGVRLCDAAFGVAFRFDGQMLNLLSLAQRMEDCRESCDSV